MGKSKLETIWIKFEDSVPECGKYKEDDLLFLATSLLSFEGNDTEIDAVRQELNALPLGIIKIVASKRIVKVLQDNCTK
jgi:hypothetical protein